MNRRDNHFYLQSHGQLIFSFYKVALFHIKDEHPQRKIYGSINDTVNNKLLFE